MSARQVYQMKVDSIIDHTPNVRELNLTCLEPRNFSFKAGQFAMLHVPQADSKPALRAYSIASDERKTNGFRLLFKYVDNGVASQYVWSLMGNETLQFTGPFGKVFFQEPPTEQIIFLNTGTGISQHLSYLVSKKELFPHIKYHLLFGVRSQKDIYLEKDLIELQKQLPHFNYHYVLSRPTEGWTGKKGYIQNFIQEFDYLNIPTTFYLCGNGGMIKETKQKLDQAGFNMKSVWSEAFD